MTKEIKVTVDGLGVNSPEDPPTQVRTVLLDNGRVIDMIVIQVKPPPYEKLEILKVG